MGKPKVKTCKINVTGMTEKAHDHVKHEGDLLGLNKAGYMKILVAKDMKEKEVS